MGRAILGIRHAAIIAVIALSLLYFYAMIPEQNAGNFNLIAIAGLAQLVPALFGGLLWRRGQAAGAIAGILGGFAIWLYYIAAPQFLANIGVIHDFGIRLASAAGTDQFVRKVLLSQLVNVALYVGVSLAVRPRIIDHVPAGSFVGPAAEAGSAAPGIDFTGTVGDLKALLGQFL